MAYVINGKRVTKIDSVVTFFVAPEKSLERGRSDKEIG